MVHKQKEAYRQWLPLQRDFPITERFGIGRKIDTTFLDVLEYTRTAAYLPQEPKILWLGKAIAKLDTLKFFMQLAWESKLMPLEKYLSLSEQLEEIGGQLGAWRKGLQNKTLTCPPNSKR